MKSNWKYALTAGIIFVITSFSYLVGLLDRTDLFLNDVFYHSYRNADPRIFVIGIDSETLNAYGPWGGWSRMITADLIRYLNEDEETKPAVIGIDIIFSGNTTDREDNALSEAVHEGGNVVLASQAYFKSDDKTREEERTIIRYDEPFDELRSAASGMINLFTDSDGVVRRGIYEYNGEGKTIRSFGAQIVQEYAKQTGTSLPEPPPTDKNGLWYIPYAAKPGAYFGSGIKGTSWIRVMDKEIPRELFQDSIVLVGPYAGGMMDHHYTSADRSAPMFGIEIHANMIQSLLEGYYKQNVPGYIVIGVVLVLSILLFTVFIRGKIKHWTLFSIGSVILYFVAALGVYQLGWILPLFYPLLSLVLLYLSLLITNSIMLTVEKASLYDRMHQLFINSIKAIATAIDAKDPCTSGHCQRVAEYSLMLGKGLGCSEKELEELEYSALLHDVGKIGISDSILRKEGSLTDEEYAEMKQHPNFGAKILGEVKEFSGRISEGAKYHHERYDGKGYCTGLSGEEIPLFGRIISIADTYDAMTQNRPYRRRLSKQIAIEELNKNSGKQFDPVMVEIFVRLLQNLDQPDEAMPVQEEEKE